MMATDTPRSSFNNHANKLKRRPMETVETLTAYIHHLIHQDPKQARHYLEHQMSSEVLLNVSKQVFQGETLLTCCISAGANSLLECLIKECQLDLEQECFCDIARDGTTDHVSCSPLLKAVLFRNTKAAQILLDLGANVNVGTAEGFTALHGACGLGKLDMVRCLVKAGADLSQRTSLGTTCLMNAIRSPDIRRYLLEQGSEVNAVNVYERTVLHQAVLEGCVESIQVILKSGADPNLQDTAGNTGVLLAVFNGRSDIITCLLAHQACPYIRNIDNTDCFLAAVETRQDACLNVLLEYRQRQNQKINS